jgi:hypothetical protein
MKKSGIILILLTAFIVLLISVNIKKYADSGVDIMMLNNMYNDIEELENKVSIYYLNYGYLPVNKERAAEFKDKSINPNDSEEYYEIDLSVLDDLDITYGKKELGEDDVYIINYESHTVYYVKGIIYAEKTYYTRPVDYEVIKLENY